MRAASTPWTVSGSSSCGSSAVAVQRPSSRTIPPSSMSWRRISSRKKGLPSARARMRPRVWSGRPSTSSRCATSSPAASRDSGLRKTEETLRRPPPHVGLVSVSSGRAGQTKSIGPSARPASSSSRSSSIGSAQWMSSITTTSRSRWASAESRSRQARLNSTCSADGCSREKRSSPLSSPSVKASAATRSERSPDSSGSASATSPPIRSTTTAAGSSSETPASAFRISASGQ